MFIPFLSFIDLSCIQIIIDIKLFSWLDTRSFRFSEGTTESIKFIFDMKVFVSDRLLLYFHSIINNII